MRISRYGMIVCTLPPPPMQAHVSLAVAQISLKQYGQAMATLENVLEISPGYVPARYM